MDGNEEEYDSGYIGIIDNEKFLYIEYDLYEEYYNNKRNNNNNNEKFNQFYHSFEYNEEKGFTCIYRQCDRFEPQEEDIVKHVIKHLSQEIRDQKSSQRTCDNGNNGEECKRFANNSGNDSFEYVCDRNGCLEWFSDKICFDNHLTEHLIQEILDRDRNSVQTQNTYQFFDEELRQYLEVLIESGRYRYFCKVCGFKSGSNSDICRHIRRSHLNNCSNDSPTDNSSQISGGNCQTNQTANERSFTRNKSAIYSCHDCGQIFQSIVLYASHLSEHTFVESLNSTQSSADMWSSNKSIQKYMQYKLKDGKYFYICMICSHECKSEKGISHHIHKQHMLLISNNANDSTHESEELNNSQNLPSPQTMASNESQHSLQTNSRALDSTVSDVTEDSNSYIQIVSESLNVDMFETEKALLLRHTGFESYKNPTINKYIELKVIEGNNRYMCKWKGCESKVYKAFRPVAKHIYSTHIRYKFKCNQPNCNKSYQSADALIRHQKNHNCGFGIRAQHLVCWKCRNDNLSKYVRKQVIDGKPSFSCKWIGCHFKTYSRSGLAHIHDQHVCPHRNRNDLRFTHNRPKFTPQLRDQISLDSKQNSRPFICRKLECKARFHSQSELLKHQNLLCNYKKIDKNLIHSKIQQNARDISLKQSSKSIAIQTCTSSNISNKTIDINQKIQQRHVDDEVFYFCKSKECKYSSRVFGSIVQHIKETHIQFNCDIENCSKSFHNQEYLQIHKNNHICGFGIKDRKPIGVCDIENVKKYRNKKKNGNKMVYSCKWSGCGFETETSDIALVHIHNRHICPNRLRTN